MRGEPRIVGHRFEQTLLEAVLRFGDRLTDRHADPYFGGEMLHHARGPDAALHDSDAGGVGKSEGRHHTIALAFVHFRFESPQRPVHRPEPVESGHTLEPFRGVGGPSVDPDRVGECSTVSDDHVRSIGSRSWFGDDDEVPRPSPTDGGERSGTTILLPRHRDEADLPWEVPAGMSDGRERFNGGDETALHVGRSSAEDHAVVELPRRVATP